MDAQEPQKSGIQNPGNEKSALILFEVEDTGSGIYLEEIQLLFEPFKQTDKPNINKFCRHNGELLVINIATTLNF